MGNDFFAIKYEHWYLKLNKKINILSIFEIKFILIAEMNRNIGTWNEILALIFSSYIRMLIFSKLCSSMEYCNWKYDALIIEIKMGALIFAF